MNPFPANSISDTDNEPPSSSSEVPTVSISSSAHPTHSNGLPPQQRQPSQQPNGTTAAPPQQSANRRYSYPGQRGGFFGSSNRNLQNNNRRWKPRPFLRDGSFVEHELLAVLLWSLAVPLLSLLVVRLHEQAQSTTTSTTLQWLGSTLAWLVVHGCLPSQLPTGQCPGFLLSHIWLLQWVYRQVPVVPHWGCRVAEWRLGRLPKRALVVSLVLHIVVPAFVWGTLGLLAQLVNVPGHAAEEQLYLAVYDAKDDPLIPSLFLKEVLLNALVPVAVWVVPSLLQLNDLSPWLSLLVVYPLYTVSVDTTHGRGSSLSVTSIIAQALLHGQVRSVNWRVWAQLMGCGVGGLLMEHVFPDEPGQEPPPPS